MKGLSNRSRSQFHNRRMVSDACLSRCVHKLCVVCMTTGAAAEQCFGDHRLLCLSMCLQDGRVGFDSKKGLGRNMKALLMLSCYGPWLSHDLAFTRTMAFGHGYRWEVCGE
eukprot:1029022-Amphidinium_carterae.1